MCFPGQHIAGCIDLLNRGSSRSRRTIDSRFCLFKGTRAWMSLAGLRARMRLEQYVSDEILVEFFMLEAEKRSSSFLPWGGSEPRGCGRGQRHEHCHGQCRRYCSGQPGCYRRLCRAPPQTSSQILSWIAPRTTVLSSAPTVRRTTAPLPRISPQKTAKIVGDNRAHCRGQSWIWARTSRGASGGIGADAEAGWH